MGKAARSYAEIRKKSLDDLVKEYDEVAEHTVVGLDFIKQEIWRRDSEKLNCNMARLTRRIYWLTIVITILTAINVFGVLVSIL